MGLDSRPFILHGNFQLEIYREQIERALGAWLQNWFKDLAVTPQLIIAPFDKTAETIFDGQVWHRLVGMDASSLYLSFDGFQAKEFLTLLFGLSHGDPMAKSNGEVNWEVVQELFNDFVCRWGRPTVPPEARVELRWEKSVPPESFQERGSGVLLLTLSIGKAIVKFIVPPAILQRLLPKSDGTVTKRATSRISEVLGRESVQLFVTIGADQEVPFSALLDLNVGDVILLNRRIQEPFNLINANGARLGGCHIGRRGENRAIHIAASTAAGNSKGIPIKS